MQAFSLWVEFETRKVKPTEEVLYSEKIQLVRVREVAPSVRTETQELHETGFRYESSIIHVNRPS